MLASPPTTATGPPNATPSTANWTVPAAVMPLDEMTVTVDSTATGWP